MKPYSVARLFIPSAAGLALAAITLIAGSAKAASGNWNVDALGNWSAATNWSSNPSVPGTSAGDTVGLNINITAARTVTIDTTSRTVGILNIGDPTSSYFAYTLAASGGATLTFNNIGSGAQINKTGPSTAADAISAPIVLSENLTVNIAQPLSLQSITASGKTITKTGAGTLTVAANNSATLTTNSIWLVNAGTFVIGHASTLGASANTLTVAGGNLDTTSAGQSVAQAIAQNWNSDFTFIGSGALNLGSGPVTLNATRQVTVNANVLTVGGAIGGSGAGLTKAGIGTLVLTGADTYTGTTTVNGGVLRLSHATSVAGGLGASGGTSGLTLTGGVVELGAGDLLRNLGSGASQFQISGGTSGFSSYGGLHNIIVNNDATTEVQWGGANFAPATLVLNESTATDTLVFQNKLDLNGATRTVNVNAATAVISGDVRTATGNAGLTKGGNGTLVFTGTNTYNGATTVNAGVLSVATTASLPGYSTSGNVVCNGGTVRVGVGGSGWTTGNVDSLLTNATKTSGALGLDTSYGDLTQWTVFTPGNLGSLGLNKHGTNTLTLNQVNSYTGATTLSGGTLKLLNSSGLTQTLSGGLAIAGPDVTVLSDYNSGSGTLSTTFGALTRSAGSSVNFVINGGTAGSSNLVKLTGSAGFVNAGAFYNGADFAWLSGANGYVLAFNYGVDPNAVNNPTSPLNAFTSTSHYRLTGSFTESNTGTAASLKIDGGSGGIFTQTAGALYTPAILKTGGGVYTFSGGALRGVNGDIVIRTDGASDQVIVGGFDTAANLTKSGAGTLTFTISNAPLNNIYVNGGTLEFGTAGSINNAVSPIFINTGATFLYNSTTAKTLSGGLSGGGNLTKNNSSTLTLAASNSFSGTTTISAGTLSLTHSLALQNSILDTANSMTGLNATGLKTTVTTLTLGALSGNKDLSTVFAPTSGGYSTLTSLTLNPGMGISASYSGAIGNGALGMSVIKTGAGTQTLSGINTYTGTTSVNQGTLALAGGSLASPIIVANGAYLGLTVGSPTTSTASVTLNEGHKLRISGSVDNSSSYKLIKAASISGVPTLETPIANYTLELANNATELWLVSSSACSMLSCNFGVLGQATISEDASTVVLTVPPNQSVTSLAPTFSFSPNATLSPASGSTQDFTQPVVYRVTAGNGAAYKDYTVSVQTYNSWAHSGSMFINTMSAGANLAPGASVSNFPLLVRLNSSNFNFAEAQNDGSDIRFSTSTGADLPYQIDRWDSVGGNAAVWVKIPTITGNSTQEIKIYWGKSGVGSLSSGAGVFNSSNGYASVLHMDDALTDTLGTTTPSNVNTTVTNGLIGKARTFSAGQGVLCGTSISGLPSGAGSFSTGVWIRTATAPSNILGWGIQQASGKVVMTYASPPHVSMDCFFGGANVTGTATIPTSAWTYVVHTFQSNSTKLYVNGALDASTSGGGMNIPTPCRFELGGWSGTYSFVGDMDEVRISNVVRSADWVKLEYENQKPLQTLIGGIVPAGSAFSVSPTSLTINEGISTTLTAQAGAAQKVYWIYLKNGQQTVLATDQLTLNYTAGRVTGNDSAVIQFMAVFAGGTQTMNVPLTVLDTVPDPVFTLTPSTPSWDGRETMSVTANVTNLAAMQAAGFGTLNYNWSVNGVAVIKQASNGTLTLIRSQGSGPMTVTLTVDNGGTLVSSSVAINVQEPASDAWIQRTPDVNEKPVDKQFFARDPGTGLGTIYYCGTQAGATDVYLNVYTTDTGADVLYATYHQTLAGGAYSFAVPISAGKVTYKVTYGTTTGGVDSAPLATVSDLVCGDAFVIEGQSNAVALQNTALEDNTTNKWIRTYSLSAGWGYAVKKSSTSPYVNYQLGVWGWYLANRLITHNNMPVCFINGAVGGTRIDQHQPNPAGHGSAGSLYSIYANLYNRVVGAKLTHGIRAVLWHQGEQDQGSEGPDGDYDYKFYQQHFVDISAAWKQDFPNIRNYYLFQIWPGACGDTSRNDQLREVQRNLPKLYSNMRVMSTLGIVPGSSCHYDEAGYAVFSDLIGPLVEQDVYAYAPPNPITAPNLQQAYFTTPARNEIALVFGQNIAWNPGAPTMLFLADANGASSGSVSAGSAFGNTITLQVSGASSAATITYVKGQVSWQQGNILYGTNALAALTFADVAIGSPPPAGLIATGGSGQVALSWTATTGATSYNVKRATTSGGPYTTLATTAASAITDVAVVAGTPYFYVVSAVKTVGTSSSEGLNSTEATATPLGGYTAWAAELAQGLTAGVNDGPLMDPDSDGITNLMEFVLGSAPMVSSQSKLPTLKSVSGQWLFEYDRNRASLPPATTQVVQFSSDMKNWTDIPVTANNSGAVTVTLGSVSDHVAVVIPSINPQTFVRLKVAE